MSKSVRQGIIVAAILIGLGIGRFAWDSLIERNALTLVSPGHACAAALILIGLLALAGSGVYSLVQARR